MVNFQHFRFTKFSSYIIKKSEDILIAESILKKIKSKNLKKLSMTKFYNNKKNLVIVGSSGRMSHSLLMNELEKGNNVVGIDLNQKINKTLQNKNYFYKI